MNHSPEQLEAQPEQANVANQTIAFLRECAEGGGRKFEPDDLKALADMMEAQQSRIDDAVAIAGRAALIAQLARTFALNQVKLPGFAAVEQFLRDYIDDGNFSPIPWPPEDMGSLTRFLRDRGYANIDGFVNRAIGQNT